MARTPSSRKAPLIGAHVSTSGGFGKAIDRALTVGCRAMQVFVKNNMRWFANPLTAKEVDDFHHHVRRKELDAVFGHTGYLINLAADKEEFHNNSIRSLSEELVRADQLNLPFLVLHPGAHMGAGEEAGLAKVIASLDAIHAALPDVRTRVALEITAGQGTCLGHRFEHLATIIAGVKHPGRLCVCLDTAHLFAAGYDISTEAGAKKTFKDFDRVVGGEKLVAIHMNDSKAALGSHVDRHDHIGKGKIGLEAFRYIMRASRFEKVPKVLETPKGPDMKEDVENLAVLRSMLA